MDCIHDITAALAFARMTDSAYRVDTISRLAQWRIHNLSSSTYRKSDPFKMGLWNWYLSSLSFLFFSPDQLLSNMMILMNEKSGHFFVIDVFGNDNQIDF